MEPWLLLLALHGPPVRVDAHAVWCAGLAPLPLPGAVLPPAERARRILLQTDLSLGERVEAALAWGEDVQALRAAVPPGPLSADPRLDRALTAWAGQTARRLGLGDPGALVALDAAGRARAATADERLALADAQGLLSSLAWPRWCGALVLVPHGLAHPVLEPGRARQARPALPVLRIPAGGRPELAAAIADLALALSVPPPRGWPSWLTAGVAAGVRARAAGTPTSPEGARDRRAAAGAAAIAALLDADVADPLLAEAVVAPLLHPARVAVLPELLRRLRQGEASAAALGNAYGLTPARMADPGR